MTWNTAGTAGVTQGSRTLNGTGTDWISQEPGWFVWLRGEDRPHELAAIVSASEITLVDPVEMATATGVEFIIIPTRGLIDGLRASFDQMTTGFQNAKEAWDLISSNFSATTYQLWLDLGNVGTVADFLDTLVGVGEDGPRGLNNHELWLGEGNTGTVQDYLDEQSNGAASASSASAAAALASEGAAAQSASDASADALQTGQDRAAVENLFDYLDDRFLGPKASDPALDNDGDPLVAGTRYWNTTAGEGRVYNGTAWEAPSTSATASAQQAMQAKTDAETAAGNAQTSESNAATSASVASLASGATEWVSAANYAAFQGLFFSILDGQTYRPKTTHSGITTDPSADAVNWVPATAPGVGDMEKSVYDPTDSGTVDEAKSVPWAGIPDKPATFPPDGHTHGIPAITGLQAALDGKAGTGAIFSGAYADLTGKPALFSGAYADLSGKPTLGSAAALAAGTGANNAVQLDGNGNLPAVDGSALTNMAFERIEKITIGAGLAAQDIALPDGFVDFRLVAHLTRTGSDILGVRASFDAGQNFDDGGSDYYNGTSNGTAFFSTIIGSNCSVTIDVLGAKNASGFTGFAARHVGVAFYETNEGCHRTNVSINALRLFTPSGTIPGEVWLYGLKGGA